MPTAVRTVVAYRHAAQYTGSNSAELAEAIPSFTIMDEQDGTLVFESGGSPWTMHTGDWALWTGEGIVTDIYYPQLMDQVYKDLPTS